MKVYQLIGYPGTGKDTLFSYINKKQDVNQLWKVYSKDGSDLTINSNLESIAYAKRLKQCVIEYLQPNYNLSLDDIEKYKRTPQLFSLPDSEKKETMRNILYLVGDKIKQEHGRDYFVSYVRDFVKHASFDVMITDLRFLLEYEEAINHKDILIRLYRSVVPNPESLIEHYLDGIETDYLLVPSEEDFQNMLSLFPQYKNFVPTKFVFIEDE